MTSRLSGKICLVTGAARGIGRAIAEAFQAEGASVVATDIDEAGGMAMAARTGCRFQRLDVRREADWDALATIVPEVDVVVNNAGITGFKTGGALRAPDAANQRARPQSGPARVHRNAQSCRSLHLTARIEAS